MDEDLAVALELADLADRATLPAFESQDFRVETKPDLSLVTEVDRDVEALLRDRIARHRPGDEVAGEEMGGAHGGPPAGRRWILDPIDGTHNFVHGIPVYATLISLQDGPDLRVGPASAPALGRRWWAVRGPRAFVAGRGVAVTNIDSLRQATRSFTTVV